MKSRMKQALRRAVSEPHENPNPQCPVGRNIHKVLDEKLARVQKAMEDEMQKITLAEIAHDTEQCIKNEG